MKNVKPEFNAMWFYELLNAEVITLWVCCDATWAFFSLRHCGHFLLRHFGH